MAWTDKPTYNQAETIYRWIEWHMPHKEAAKAIHWFKENATRKEASDEIARLYELHHAHKLDKEGCFRSSVWEKYNPDEYEYVPHQPSDKPIVDYGK